ncbi:MAG: protein kinase [Planctomycetes bacterium]|nr:protein kinase [Planctomycetota bacterium]
MTSDGPCPGEEPSTERVPTGPRVAGWSPAAALPDRYKLLAPLGRGGMAVVHRAFDSALGREVAVKVLLEDAAAEPEGRARFRREAEAVGRLAHPNVITIFDAGPNFLVMELAPGGPLRRPTPELLEKVARGVHAAHDCGIVHRDLKPSNVLLTREGEPKVSDFGLAHLAGEHTRLTRTGAVFGTPPYMAPEQVEGRIRDISPRTDVYALGAMLYEALTGAPPFLGATAIEIFGKIVHQEPAPPSRLADRVPPELETIALKALEKDPARRFATALEFAEDLRRWRTGEPILARPPSAWFRLRRGIALRKTPIAAAGVGLAALSLALLLLLPALARARRTLRLWGDVSVILADAELYGRAGDLEHARARLDEGIRLCRGDDSAEALYFLGRLHHARRDEAEAVRFLDAALARNPGFGEAHFERGLVLVERYGREQDRALWRFSGRTPEDAPAAPEESEREAGSAELRAQAIADLSVAVGETAYFRPVDARFGKAELARLRWDWAKAEAELRGVLASEPLYARAWLALALMANLRLDREHAEEFASQALAQHKGLGAAWRVRSHARFWRAEAANAPAELLRLRKQCLEDAEEAIRLGEPAWAARGNARWKLGDRDGALADFARTLELEPRDALTRNHRGVLWVEKNDLAAALADFDKAVELAPGFGQAWANRALARALEGDHAGAVSDAHKALDTASRQAAYREKMEALLGLLEGPK